MPVVRNLENDPQLTGFKKSWLWRLLYGYGKPYDNIMNLLLFI
jgi:hypothetical protein